MSSERIEGWEQILKYLPHSYSKSYRLHAKEMLANGYVIKTHVNRGRAKKNP